MYLIKSDSKAIYNISISILIKKMLFILTFYLSKNAEKMYHGFHKKFRQHNFIQFIFAITGIDIFLNILK